MLNIGIILTLAYFPIIILLASASMAYIKSVYGLYQKKYLKREYLFF